MRILLFSLLFASALLAQNSAVFPGAIATNTDLPIAKNNASTTLNGSITNSATTIVVSSAALFTAPSLITIEGEAIRCTTLVSNTFSGCSRGFDGTAAASHLSGKAVKSLITAWHFNQLAAEVKSIENTMGVNAGNIAAAGPAGGLLGGNYPNPTLGAAGIDYITQIANKAVLDTREYNFTSTNGGTAVGSLGTPGVNTVTLTPCPKGVNGADILHSVYLSNGTGTAEAVTITGGTCTSGATTGTLFFTTSNAHTGAWTIASASSGIRECFIVSGGSSKGCYTPSGTYNFYATIYNDHLVPWYGDGSTSVIQQQFAGDGIVIGPTVFAGNLVNLRNLRHQYGFGLGAFASSGSGWTFRNVSDGVVTGLSTILGYEGFTFAGSVRVEYTNLYSNSKNVAFHWGSVNPGNAGWFSNIYGTVQANGILALFDPNIIGLSFSNFLLEAAGGAPGAGTVGIQLNQTSAGPINELVIANGFVDSIGTSALLTNYTAAGGQNASSTIHIENIRFTSVGSAPTGVFSAPMFGFKVVNNTFANGGTGDAVTVSGLKGSNFTGNHFDVAAAGGRGLVIQAAAGGELNTDLNFTGNMIGFNGAAVPTTAIATDAAAHTGIRFSGNKIKGAIAWSATGAANAIDISNQFSPDITFATLPAFGNGASVFCSNCNATCTAGGSTGRTCFRENGAWTH